jgi:hypothetical protein
MSRDQEISAALARLDTAIAAMGSMEMRIRTMLEKQDDEHRDRVEASRAHLSQLWDSLGLREMRNELREIKVALVVLKR